MEKKHSEEKAVDILISNIIKEKALNLKVIPDWILDMMHFNTNGPSHVLSTISIYYYLNSQEKSRTDTHKIEIPFKKMLKLTRDIGFLCQVERLRRKRVVDYSIDMGKIFDPDTKISISKGPNFLKTHKDNLIV